MGEIDRALLKRLLGETWAAQDIADLLLASWPSLPAVLSASNDEIEAVAGSSAAKTCQTMQDVIAHITHHAIEDRPLLGSSKELSTYLRHRMAFKPREEMRVLFLNASNRLICDEVTGAGGVDTVLFEPREVLRRALELRSTALILAHNHPGGNPRPSKADVAASVNLLTLAGLFDIAVHDHIVVTRSGCSSLRTLGLLGGKANSQAIQS